MQNLADKMESMRGDVLPVRKRPAANIGGSTYTAAMLFLSGVVVAAIAGATWYAGAAFTLDFIRMAVKILAKQEFFGWWIWLIPVAVSILEVALLKFVGDDLELKALLVTVLTIDAVTTAAGAFQWFDQARLTGGLPIYLTLGIIMGVGLAVVPEIMLRKAAKLVFLAFRVIRH